ncbi:MAG: NIPSNAP family protein [Chitinophagaceae bacterium]|nr:NIPSNAP family protein [Chitinophagaceae bacterium]
MEKKWIFICLLLLTFTGHTQSKRDYYLIRVYHCKNDEQLIRTETFIEKAWKPTAKRYGITKIGVFKPINNDTAVIKKLYLLIPTPTTDYFYQLEDRMMSDRRFQEDGAEYIQTKHDHATYERFETIVLRSFTDMPHLGIPSLKNPAQLRVYELRSYESASEKIYRKKVEMFNKGGEIKLFKRLNFNAIFYGEVLSGPRMPNLMYMTSFENINDRNEHWKSFIADSEWKKLSSMPEYQNTVSKIDIVFLAPTHYSDL